MAASEATDSDTTSAAPPGLHAAESEDRECGNCTFYRSSDNACTKFPPLCVSDDWLCGAWKAGGKDTDDATPNGGRASMPTTSIHQATRQVMAALRAAKTS